MVDVAARQIIAAVCLRHNITESRLIRPGRAMRYVRARWEAMALLRRAGLSLPKIGRLLGRHHTSVLTGLRRYSEICFVVTPLIETKHVAETEWIWWRNKPGGAP